MHSGKVCWISLAGVEFVWKAWIFHEKFRKKTPKNMIFISNWAKSDEFCI